MAKDHLVTISGIVTDIFNHRFVVETADGKVLADLGPNAAAVVALQPGERIDLQGERKPSELKVARISTARGTIEIGHKKRDHDADADPAVARRIAETIGLTVIREPRRRPKHFEVVGRDPSGRLLELHVDFDGTLRKTTRVAPDDGHATVAPA